MRLPDWPERLDAAVADARRNSFAWGSHDCATWACDTAAAITGTNSHAEAWRGRYSTAAGSVRVMRKLGWRDLGELGDSLFGGRIPVLMAGRGDLALVDGALGVVAGQSVAVLAEDGVLMMPLRDADAAWRIG
ncbi:hypothetical protein P6F26_16865 [Roseibacterium sp. SDUM158017]|uniref:DUF6950 family protein n=1 Tax=Roseicyclus salinarum TaxID=3036773 RepID=UPI002414D270|nr:hypothetical protein [Roseibacterium sp. SDUM158017]MDG4650122.1 hypothetical protein [Roseibacterium sp. SDUM158017]